MDSVLCRGFRSGAVLGILLLLVVFSASGSGEKVLPEGRTRIICVDHDGVPLANATLVLERPDVSRIISGPSDPDGEIYITGITEQLNYSVRILWRERVVYSGDVGIQPYTILTISCDVYSLTIRLNWLGIFPVDYVEITIRDADSEQTIEMFKGRPDIPYGFYRLSAEQVFRLPKGHYDVIAGSTNTDARSVELDRTTSIEFTGIPSIGSILLLMSIVIALASFVAFLIYSRTSRKGL